MPVLSHLHQLVNTDQCQAYIHTLRWKDRPLQCPCCQSYHIGRWGVLSDLTPSWLDGVNCVDSHLRKEDE